MPKLSESACSEFRRLQRAPRRAVLEAGALGMLGLGLPGLWTGSAATSDAGVVGSTFGLGRAKRCVFLFMWGGPSQLDTFDMKPEAPPEIRGSFQSIATPVPGLQICEHFRNLAPLMDRVAIVRSLTHDDPAHLSSAHTVLTGHLPPVNKSDDVPPSERDTPHIGSVIAKLHGPQNGLPPAVTMPWLAYHPSAPGGVAPGQHGGWLGRTFDPLLVGGDPGEPTWSVPALALMDGLSSSRLVERRRLLNDIESQRRDLDRACFGAAAAGVWAAGIAGGADGVRPAGRAGRRPGPVRTKYTRTVCLARTAADRARSAARVRQLA
jgi:hypothetical protein